MKTRANSNTSPWANIPATFPLVRGEQVRKETALSNTTLYEMVKAGLFPPPIKIGPRAVAWPRAWLDAFLKDRAEESVRLSHLQHDRSGR